MKPICLIECSIKSRSGYGVLSRDVARHFIALGKYDVRIVPTMWGMTPNDDLDPVKDKEIFDCIMQHPYQLERQPEVFVQVAIPNEFKTVGKYNIAVTAGIETNMCSEAWLEGCNRMDLVLATSQHSKAVFENTIVEHRDPQGNSIKQVKLQTPCEVLPISVDLSIFHRLNEKDISDYTKKLLSPIKEEFAFLFVGHWLKGGLGEDRKNVGVLVKTFLETFKDVSPKNRPALILKTSGAGFSLLDRKEIRDKIQQIKNHVGGDLPNIYLVHGDLSNAEMNELYNHPKVKSLVSFTKGEGYGLPILEFSVLHKPIICSGWSGQLDFLNPTDALLVGGEVRQIEQGAVWDGVLIAESAWFNVDPDQATKSLRAMFKNYSRFLDGAHRLAKKNKEQFSTSAVTQQLNTLISKYVPTFAVPRQFKLPELRPIV